MPLIPTVHQFIEAEVRDRAPGVKQKARFIRMEIVQNPENGVLTVLVRVRVDLYQDSNGAYGPLLFGKGIGSYEVTLVADNNTAVYFNPENLADPRNGDVLYIRSTEREEEWSELLNGKAEPLLLQGDFFELLMHNVPVEVGATIRKFLLQADQAPFNKFSA